jgi:hypothetical protein
LDEDFHVTRHGQPQGIAPTIFLLFYLVLYMAGFPKKPTFGWKHKNSSTHSKKQIASGVYNP